jgi:glycosyltransferase involved in cell wall biosynthesis
MLKPLTKAKYILYPQGTFANYNTQVGFKKIFDALFQRAINSAINVYIVLSDVEKKTLIDGGVRASKIKVIDYGIDGLEMETKKELSFSYSYILYLGRIDKRKGVDLLIKAYKKSGIYQKNVHMVVAGNDSGFVSECRKLVQKYALQRFIHFIGPIRAERASLYKSARLVAYVTENETYGLVPIEAALCGTASIVDGDSGVARVLEKYRIGYRVKYGDIESLARVLEKEGWKKNNVSGDKIRRLLEEYSWKAIAKRFLEVYQNV